MSDPTTKVIEAARRVLDEIDALAAESNGVLGLHLNGDLATWDWLYEEWLAGLAPLRSALDAPAPSPPETPAPVHFLARFAAGSFIACDPTIKDGWTPDPLAVTCEECRKVIRWRCGQAPVPETPAREGTMGDRDRLRDGIEAAARVLAANGIDARSHLDLRPDARREITEILASAPPASAPSRGTDHDPATKEQS